jgi:hypothetical protein
MVGGPSRYVGSAVVVATGLLAVYLLALPLMKTGVAEQDDTLEPEGAGTTADGRARATRDWAGRRDRWPARRQAGVNLADCAPALSVLSADFIHFALRGLFSRGEHTTT